MLGRFETVCAVTIASWFAGVALARYLETSGGWLSLSLVSVAGLIVAPFIGFRLVTSLPDITDWESWGPRDFFIPALALAAVICFAVPAAIFWLVGG
jgi:hypothetical protein